MKALLPATMILVISAGWAADLRSLPDDPTRPPDAALAADGSPLSGATVGLSSVMMPKKGRPAAVIDGQVVLLGGVIREATLVSVTENSVILEGAGGREKLYLTPAVEKTVIKKTAARRQREQ